MFWKEKEEGGTQKAQVAFKRSLDDGLEFDEN